ncbi:L,D-transpeptidase family protein [Thalassotalea sp. LPB0316]|uniref:L,D-transpeptidase family protein n=1 Tax=Thalassotalea sp. LPB0316 TaxID=2769490 RepID=UPI001D0431C8|nr:L,D-transpeptidase family protein [Thalassotalea sp. LPB0316]
MTLWLAICSYMVEAKPYLLPQVESRLIGQDFHYTVREGDYFQAIAEKFNVGFLALIDANPELDPFLPAVGSKMIIPNKMLLPFVPHEGIVINLPELRLYYFSAESAIVHVFPVGIGKQGLATPKTKSYIGEKRKDPVWRPTKEMQARYLAEHGKPLAKEVPAGPDNPFGKYALRLGTSEYLIHGSNQRIGIGMRSSSGCIRLFDDDIEWLYNNVPEGTVVRIIDQPIKMSYETTGKHIEVHRPLSDGERLTDSKYQRILANFLQSEKEQQAVSPLLDKPTGLVVAL